MRVIAAPRHVVETVVNKSRFVCTLYRVADEAAVRELIAAHRKAHWDATHNCTAFVLEGGAVARSSDDGEPAGTAGAPMLQVLRGRDLTDVLAVVTRYFGGVKLGAGGLVRAYGRAVSAAVDDAGTVELAVWRRLRGSCGYGQAGSLEAQLRARDDVRVLEFAYGESVSFVIAAADVDAVRSWLGQVSAGEVDVVDAGEVRVEL